jgi:hypothetical protein
LQENVGLDGLMEDAKGPAMNPLWRRLNTFLNMAKPRMAAIMLQVKCTLSLYYAEVTVL